MTVQQLRNWPWALVMCIALCVAPVHAQSTRERLGQGGPGRVAPVETYVAKLGSAGSTGLYHSVGTVLCGLVNGAQTRVRCEVEPTTGTLVNLNSLRAGELEFAFAQADWIGYALRGAGPFKGNGPFADVRSVFSLHTEAVTVVMRPDLDSARVDDLRQRSLSVGPIGSGSRATFEAWLAAHQQTRGDFPKLAPGGLTELAGSLCGSRIDAYWLVIGHPAPALQEGFDTCALKIMPLTGAAVEQFLQRQPHFRSVEIAANTYRGQAQPVQTIGTPAVLVSHTRVPDDVVYALVRSAFERLAALRQAHPALVNLDPREMATRGIVAPIHPGALRYFRERGWM